MTGHYLPFAVVGAALGSIGAGLMHTLDVGSTASHWIGYQALAGIGFGLGLQIPVIVAQAVVDPSDISSVTAIMIFFQTLAGAIFVSIGQSLFANKLSETVQKLVPGLDPHLVVATGATRLRTTFNAEQLPGVIQSFMAGLKDAYALGIALASVATIIAILAVIFDRRRIHQQAGAASGAA